MHMHVRLLAVPREIVLVLVVLVMSVRVRMLHRLVHVLMFMPLAQVP